MQSNLTVTAIKVKRNAQEHYLLQSQACNDPNMVPPLIVGIGVLADTEPLMLSVMTQPEDVISGHHHYLRNPA